MEECGVKHSQASSFEVRNSKQLEDSKGGLSSQGRKASIRQYPPMVTQFD